MADSTSRIKAENLFSVNGLVAVITGGGSGLGAMMARALATNGAAKVFIIGRRSESLESVASSVPSSNIIPVVGDVTSKDSLTAAVKAITETHKVAAIDVLICNSGISGPSVPMFDGKQQPLPLETVIENMWEPTPEEVTNTYAVNVTGVHFAIAAFLPLLKAANDARPTASNNDAGPSPFKPRPQIITTGSIGGFLRRPLGNLSYGPSKAAVMHMTKQLATSLVPYDIRANIIAPGLYFSEMTEGMYRAQGKAASHNLEGTFDRSQVPATRTGDEEDMAGVVLWLCSRAGGYVNGNVVVTDGGRMSVIPGSY